MNRNGCYVLVDWRMAIVILMRRPLYVRKVSICTWVSASPQSRLKKFSNVPESPFTHKRCPTVKIPLLTLYQDKLQDVEHQMAVLTSLRTRLKERIACLQRQLQAE